MIRTIQSNDTDKQNQIKKAKQGGLRETVMYYNTNFFESKERYYATVA